AGRVSMSKRRRTSMLHLARCASYLTDHPLDAVVARRQSTRPPLLHVPETLQHFLIMGAKVLLGCTRFGSRKPLLQFRCIGFVRRVAVRDHTRAILVRVGS